MVVPEQIDAVLRHVKAKEKRDWSKEWPHGVFACSYELHTEPV